MSTDVPGLPESDLNGDDDAGFDELARRAGAALRHPAPEAGVRLIAARRRRQQALKASVVGGVAVATLIGVLVIIANRNDSDSLPPADSSPRTTTVTTTPAPTTTRSVPVDSEPVSIPAPPVAVQSLWLELEPGATAPVPPAPLPLEFLVRDTVWTGTEFIVWGGLADNPGEPPSQALAAAFDPAVGTWRRIAQPPDGVGVGWVAPVLWTGAEMLVWSDGTPNTSSAAYDPVTDTWRMIANPPVPAWGAIWFGDAAVLLGDPNGGGGSGHAYLPATDEYRRLADGPWDPGAVWTGTTIIVTTDIDGDGNGRAAYDPATDTWRSFEGSDEGAQLLVIPGRSGAAATVVILPRDSRTPGLLLDDRGNVIGELAGRPAELAGTCETNPQDEVCMLTTQGGVLVGGEALYTNVGGSWAFNLEAQTWRATEIPAYSSVAAGDVLFDWSAGDGLVYRAPTAG